MNPRRTVNDTERSTKATESSIVQGKQSFAINLKDLIKDFDINNRASMQVPINYESSDCNTEVGHFSSQLSSNARLNIIKSSNVDSNE